MASLNVSRTSNENESTDDENRSKREDDEMVFSYQLFESV